MFGVEKKGIKKKHDNLIINYDSRHDILEISIGKPVPSFSDEENLKGLYVRRAIDSDKVTGVTIFDYSKRNKHILKKHIPFNIDLGKIPQYTATSKR